MSSRMVTSVAMTIIYEGILILLGIKFLIIAIITFDRTKINRVANPIDIPFLAELVTPKVGQRPKNNTKVGFSLKIPLVISLKLDFIIFSPSRHKFLEFSLTLYERLLEIL